MENSNLWTIVSLANRSFALPVEHVQSMVPLPAVAVVPHMPKHVRGIMTLRGDAIPVVDLRIRIGMDSLKQETLELISMLRAREDDHIRWMVELEKAVKEKREFSLATDHHLCAFGKWYYSYKTDNLMVSGILQKFKEPHREIHSIAKKCIAFAHEGNLAAAEALIQTTKDGAMKEIIRLFDQLCQQLLESMREIAVVLNVEDKSFAVCVDAVETVAPIHDSDDTSSSEMGMEFLESGLIKSIGKVAKSESLVLTIDSAQIMR